MQLQTSFSSQIKLKFKQTVGKMKLQHLEALIEVLMAIDLSLILDSLSAKANLFGDPKGGFLSVPSLFSGLGCLNTSYIRKYFNNTGPLILCC